MKKHYRYRAVVFDEFSIGCRYRKNDSNSNEHNRICSHPYQDSIFEDKSGERRGLCICETCPLGIKLEKDDLDTFEIDTRDIGDVDNIDSNEYLRVRSDDFSTADGRKVLDAYDERRSN